MGQGYVYVNDVRYSNIFTFAVGIFFVNTTQQRDAAPNSRSSPRWWSRTFLPALGLCRRIAVLRSKMGVLRTAKQFLRGVAGTKCRRSPESRKKSRLLRLLPCKRARLRLAVANNLFRTRARASFSIFLPR